MPKYFSRNYIKFSAMFGSRQLDTTSRYCDKCKQINNIVLNSLKQFRIKFRIKRSGVYYLAPEKMRHAQEKLHSF